MDTTGLLKEKEAAAFLSLSVVTLRAWRCNRRVPLAYVKLSRAIRYRVSDLEKFVADSTVGG